MSFLRKSHLCHSFRRRSFQGTETFLVLSMIRNIPACAITTSVLVISPKSCEVLMHAVESHRMNFAMWFCMLQALPLDIVWLHQENMFPNSSTLTETKRFFFSEGLCTVQEKKVEMSSKGEFVNSKKQIQYVPLWQLHHCHLLPIYKYGMCNLGPGFRSKKRPTELSISSWLVRGVGISVSNWLKPWSTDELILYI